MREGRKYLRLGFASWGDYVAERLGCELRWAQYLVRMDLLGDRFPELRAAVEAGILSALKVIHLERLLTPDLPEGRRRAMIAAAATLTVRELEAQVRQARAEDRARSTLSALEDEALANPWDPGPGSWLNFPASGRALTMFTSASEAARQLAGENLPRHTCLEYMVAERFSTIGWSPELDRHARADQKERSLLRLRAEDRARGELESMAEEQGDRPEREPDPTALKLRNRFQRRAQRLTRKLLPRELDPDSTTHPRTLDRIVQKLEGMDRELRPLMGALLAALYDTSGYRDLGCSSEREYCIEALGLDPRRAARLIRFREGIDRVPALATAYEAGRLRYLQVACLLPIVVPETAAAWAAWAAKSSVRHTREAVDQAWILALTADRTGVGTTFACLEGVEVELPPGIPLPPLLGTRQPRVSGNGNPPALSQRPATYPFRIFLPGDLTDFVLAGLRSCHDDRGLPLPDGEALAVIAAGFLMNLADPALQRLMEQFPALERDGWKCSVPTCTFRAQLSEHHIMFRGDGGPDFESNLTSLCFLHHIILLHGLLASISVSGTAPDELEWRIGRSPGEPPLLLFRGHRKLDPVADLERPAPQPPLPPAPIHRPALIRPAASPRPAAANGRPAIASAHPAAPTPYGP